MVVSVTMSLSEPPQAYQRINVEPAAVHPIKQHVPAALTPPPKHPSPTIWHYLLLCLSIFAMSCAGTLLQELHSTPPLLKSFWRLLCLSLVLFPPFVRQFIRTDYHYLKHTYCTWRTSLYMSVAALATALHFACFITSLNQTTLFHSLTLVCSHPVLLALYYYLTYQLAPSKDIAQKLTAIEWGGVVVGMLGMMLMVMDSRPGSGDLSGDTAVVHTPTLFGDSMAFIGALAMVVMLLAAEVCRKQYQVPLWLYVFPVTLLSTLPLLFATYVTEGTRFHTNSDVQYTHRVLGFMHEPNLKWMVAITFGPALCGHTLMNYLLKHIAPLAISIAITLEPLVGTLVGMVAGVSDTPSLFSMVGGLVGLAGCIATIVGTHQREASGQKQTAHEAEQQQFRPAYELSSKLSDAS